MLVRVGFRILKPSALEFVVWGVDKVGFAEGFEGFFEVGFGGGDGVGGLEVGFDFGVVAGFAVDFIEINKGSLPHVEFFSTTGDFGGGLETELKNNVDEFFVIGDWGFLDEVNARIFDVAPEDEIVLSGLVDRFHLGAHNELRKIRLRFVIFRDIDAVMLPIDGGKVKFNISEFLLEFVATLEFALEDYFFHTLIISQMRASTDLTPLKSFSMSLTRGSMRS